jgi:hypothetical protein
MRMKATHLAIALLVGAQLLWRSDGDKEQFAYSMADLERTNRSVAHLKHHLHPRFHGWISDCYHPHPEEMPSLEWLSTLSACKRAMAADILKQLAAGYQKDSKLVVYTYAGAAVHERGSSNYTEHTASLNAKYCQRWNCTFVSFAAEECSVVGQALRRLQAGAAGAKDDDEGHSSEAGGGAHEASTAHCKVELLQKLLQRHGDAQLLLWLHPAAALVDHNIDIRMVPAMHPSES